MKRILVVIFFVVPMSYALAQNCSQTLRLARSTYDQGRLHELPELMKKCMANTGIDGFTKQERVEAYKLLTMAFIYLEEPEKADSSMLLLLKTDPYFAPNDKVDPAEFLGLYKTFRTRPIYRLGLKLGANASQPNLSSSNNVSTGDSKYELGFGFTGSLVGEIPFFKKFTFAPEIQLQLQNFSKTTTVIEPSGSFVTTATHKLSYVSLPLLVQYELFDNRFKPFVSAGISIDYLFGSNKNLTEVRPNFQSIEPKTFDNLAYQNKINISAAIGGGMKRRFAGGYLIAEVRYKYGFSQITSSTNTFIDDTQIFAYKDADAIFKLNNLMLSIGYVQNFFNPKKLKRKK
jgi:outer membrane protein W